MKKSHVIISLMCAAALSLSACSSKRINTQFQTGRTAFQQGQYHDAFTDLMPAAEKGNPEAQYALGYMLFYGKGTAQNTLEAKEWFSKSAKQNYPKAKEALEMLRKQSQQESNLFSAPATQLMGEKKNSG